MQIWDLFVIVLINYICFYKLLKGWSSCINEDFYTYIKAL